MNYNYILFKKFYGKSKQGFTLAEVLITLLIIGVVASLVIPALIQDSQNAETVVQVKKYQSVLSQIVINIKSDYGSILNSPLNSNGDYVNGWKEIRPYLNLARDCGTEKGKDCWANGMYKYLNGANWVDFNNYYVLGRGIFADGTSIDYEARTNCSTNFSINNVEPLKSVCGNFYIDVNGHKPPNQAGRDVFTWHVMKNGSVYPIGSLDDKFGGCDPNSTDLISGSNGTPGAGGGCTAKVLNEGKIDY